MELLILGTLAFDGIETPKGLASDILGGSGSHCALAAALHAQVGMVTVVGEDFPDDWKTLLEKQGVDLTGVEVKPGGTLRWTCRYEPDMNIRHTTGLALNVLVDYEPKLPESYRDVPFVFLGNDSPARQRKVLSQVRNPQFVMCDTMNHWIETEREDLDQLLREVDGVVVNDEEARLLTGVHNLISAGNRILDMGPRLAIIKKGEHGAFLFSRFAHYALPAFPLEEVVDPTGAGDSFAGGIMGYLASRGRVNLWNLKRAMAHGTVAASYTVEQYGTQRIVEVSKKEIEQRYEEFVQFITP